MTIFALFLRQGLNYSRLASNPVHAKEDEFGLLFTGPPIYTTTPGFFKKSVLRIELRTLEHTRQVLCHRTFPSSQNLNPGGTGFIYFYEFKVKVWCIYFDGVLSSKMHA